MKKFLKKILFLSLIIFVFFKIEKVESLIPYYYFPTKKNLEKTSLSIGENVYQLLYFGQYKDSLNLAKLAVKINSKDEKLWLILSEAQLANKQYKKALISLNKAQTLNSKNKEIQVSKFSRHHGYPHFPAEQQPSENKRKPNIVPLKKKQQQQRRTTTTNKQTTSNKKRKKQANKQKERKKETSKQNNRIHLALLF